MNKLITVAELQNSTETELRAIFRIVSQHLVTTERYTRARQNALASLDTITLTLNKRMARGF